MQERNKVQVKIYGQEFTISGDLTRERIIKIADHVDRSMHELADSLPTCPISSLAVLAAVNCAEQHYRSLDSVNELQSQNQQLQKDAMHYTQLWEETKKSFRQYQDDAQIAAESRETLQQAYNEKKRECQKLEDIIQKLEKENSEMASSVVDMKELEAKYREVENSFFDLQMENIQLKSELDRYKKNAE